MVKSNKYFSLYNGLNLLRVYISLLELIKLQEIVSDVTAI